MELCRDSKSREREPCLCILTNMDGDDVVMHDADCSYCDGDCLETAFLEDNEFDSGSCLTFDEVESTAEEGGGVQFRTEEKESGRYVKFKTEEKRSVKCEVLESKEAQLDKYISAMQRNNARLLQRFYEVQEDQKQAERWEKEWKRKTKVTVSLRVRFSPLSGHRTVSLIERKTKRKSRE
ncbi:hypothetical protein AALO_G00108090 [Alosa alosa]|uniref:Uncharacterized protein n=1 Tax=Alosa alosa TaxID=278164 RepID=A0AAV6GTD5_9TELE|nr:hypothetical protein AALO_G00108090 [Alosa alosa]